MFLVFIALKWLKLGSCCRWQVANDAIAPRYGFVAPVLQIYSLPVRGRYRFVKLDVAGKSNFPARNRSAVF